jgi:hypothetical protein
LLAADEVSYVHGLYQWAGTENYIWQLNIGDRSTSRQHMDAAKRMVDMKGGNDKLGLNGFLSALVDTLTCAVALRNPIGKSPGLSILYITYANSKPRLP